MMFADRSVAMGDPRFVKINLERLLSKEYGRELAQKLIWTAPRSMHHLKVLKQSPIRVVQPVFNYGPLRKCFCADADHSKLVGKRRGDSS